MSAPLRVSDETTVPLGRAFLNVPMRELCANEPIEAATSITAMIIFFFVISVFTFEQIRTRQTH